MDLVEDHVAIREPGEPKTQLPRCQRSREHLIACGSFDNLEGTPARGIAEWDGTSWWAPQANTPTGTYYTAIRHQGELYAGVVRRTAREAAKRSNVDAMVRDLSEVRIGDPVRANHLLEESRGVFARLGLDFAHNGRGKSPCNQFWESLPSSLVKAGEE